MKKLAFAFAVLFYWGTARSQIYQPANPTIYGENANRIKPLLVQHLPEKDGLLLNTEDTTTQIFYNRIDSSVWVYSKAKGYYKLVSGGSGGSSQTLQSVTDAGSLTTNKITAKTLRATLMPSYNNNTEAIAAGMQNGEVYKLPYNSVTDNYLLAIVYILSARTLQSQSAINILNQNGSPILIN